MSDLPTPALRPYLPADAAVLAEIFQASIEELTGDDYSAAQQAAWASLADDEAAFGAGCRKTSPSSRRSTAPPSALRRSRATTRSRCSTFIPTLRGSASGRS